MNIPESSLKRVIIIGAGFAGVQIAKKLRRDKFQVVLIDKNNHHTFQPLLYQLATAELESSSIARPIRAMIKKTKNFHFRLGHIHRFDPNIRKIYSDSGEELSYDYLIIATGSQTNFFGNTSIEQHALPIKCVADALNLRNLILQRFERALFSNDVQERNRLMTFVIAGGGPTGVELAGALSELKNFVLQKDYPDLDISQMGIHLVQATSSLLDGMSKKSAEVALYYLKKLGVNVWFNCPVKDYDGNIVHMGNKTISSANLIWTAGVKGALIDGFQSSSIERNRLIVDAFNRVKDYDKVFAIGDIAAMRNDKHFPNAHPMTVQPALQQGATLVKNLNSLADGQKMKPFQYIDHGSMAIIGRNKAVCDLYGFTFRGFLAWLTWMFIHWIYLTGFRNRIIVLINWIIQYFQRNKKSIRLIINLYSKVQSKNEKNDIKLVKK